MSIYVSCLTKLMFSCFWLCLHKKRNLKNLWRFVFGFGRSCLNWGPSEMFFCLARLNTFWLPATKTVFHCHFFTKLLPHYCSRTLSSGAASLKRMGCLSASICVNNHIWMSFILLQLWSRKSPWIPSVPAHPRRKRCCVTFLILTLEETCWYLQITFSCMWILLER